MDYRQAIRDSERANGYHVAQSGQWAGRRSATPRNPMRSTRLARHTSMPTAAVQSTAQVPVATVAAAVAPTGHEAVHYPTTEEDSDSGDGEGVHGDDGLGGDYGDPDGGHVGGDEADDGIDDAMRVLQLESELAAARLALARAERELLRRDQAAARARREEADLQLAGGGYWCTNKRRV